MILGIIGLAFGLICLAFAVKFYFELWKWARECANVRIAVAYKRRTKWDMPLTEYLLLSRQLDRDKDYNGRVFYLIGGTAVAIRKVSYLPLRLEFTDFLKGFWKRPQKDAKPQGKHSAPSLKEGHWKGTADTPVREVS